MAFASLLRRLLPGLWAGVLCCVALLAAPAAFAVLDRADAGRYVSKLFAQEAYLSLGVGVVMLVLERLEARRQADAGQGSQFTTGMMLALGSVFCTVAGYFALQPMLTVARAGQGLLSFGQLHALSALLFALKILMVTALACLAVRQRSPGGALSLAAERSPSV